MLQIYEKKSKLGCCNSKMFFDFHETDINFDSNNVDIYCSDSFEYDSNIKFKHNWVFGIFHNFEHQIRIADEKIKAHKNNVIYITNAVDVNINNSQIVFNDFLFNRTKAYYLKQGYKSNTELWYYAGEDCYAIPNFSFYLPRNKVYLAINRTYRIGLHARPLIINYLLKYPDKGYIGDSSNKNLELAPQGNPIIQGSTIGYSPVNNYYYNDTYISIYGETIEYGSSLAITEKTFEPLLKGHFILPFSAKGFIKYLKSWGVKFPTFINYEYDDIEDYRKRYDLYSVEMQRLVNLPINDWPDLYYQNRDLLMHNQALILERPFHKIDIKKLLS